MMRPYAIALMAALFAAGPLAAQATPADTGAARRNAAPDTVSEDSLSRPGRITPRGAFLRSLVLPGWGQSEVGAPERGIIYFALEAGSLWMVYKSQQKLDEARERDRILRAAGELAFDRNSALTRDRLAQREDWITMSVFWLFFSGADAFVAGYLRDFDEHVGVAPSPTGGTQLQYTVPLGPRP